MGFDVPLFRCNQRFFSREAEEGEGGARHQSKYRSQALSRGAMKQKNVDVGRRREHGALEEADDVLCLGGGEGAAVEKFYRRCPFTIEWDR